MININFTGYRLFVLDNASVRTSEKSQLIGSVASELNDLVKNIKRPAT